jgi:hypothetical protein
MKSKMRLWIELYTWTIVSPAFFSIFLMAVLAYNWDIKQYQLFILSGLFIFATFWSYTIGTVRRQLLIEYGFKKEKK